MCTVIVFISISIAATVSFQQQTYIVNESNDKVHIVLTLSNPSSTVIVIEIINTDGSAIGE